jgi:hypothetical protein
MRRVRPSYERVILNGAKNPASPRGRSFAALRMTTFEHSLFCTPLLAAAFDSEIMLLGLRHDC